MKNALSLKIGRALNDYKALPGLQPHNWNRWFTLAFPLGVHQPQCLKWRHLSHPRNYTLRKQSPDEASGIQKEWRKVKCSSKRTVEEKPRNYFLWCKDPSQLCIGIRGLRRELLRPPATRLLGSAVWAHQAGVAEGLIYLTYRARRLSLVLSWSENQVHKSELSHLSEKRSAGSVHRSDSEP